MLDSYEKYACLEVAVWSGNQYCMSVCVYVYICYTGEPCKSAEPITMPFESRPAWTHGTMWVA